MACVTLSVSEWSARGLGPSASPMEPKPTAALDAILLSAEPEMNLRFRQRFFELRNAFGAYGGPGNA